MTDWFSELLIGMWGVQDGLQAALALLADRDVELKRLRDELPKTADGHVVYPGMECFTFDFHDPSHFIVAHRVKAVYRFKVEWEDEDALGYIGAKLSCVYASREAAEAARKEADEHETST
jgi:hypothetical protein